MATEINPYGRLPGPSGFTNRRYLSPEEYARLRRAGFDPEAATRMPPGSSYDPGAAAGGGRGFVNPPMEGPPPSAGGGRGFVNPAMASTLPDLPTRSVPTAPEPSPMLAEEAGAPPSAAPQPNPMQAAMQPRMLSPGALSQEGPNRNAIYDGMIQAGTGLLANTADPAKALAAGFGGFNKGYDERVAEDRAKNVPKITPLANGAAALLQYADGRVEIKPIDEVQKFLRKPYGDAPKGYRYDGNGNLEAIPGGPADDKARKEADAKTVKDTGSISAANNVINRVDKALEKVGFFTTGLTGAVLGKIPGTSAYNLRGDAETIKANLGFQQLQQMRDSSPTGGALGQVAVQELNALQAVVSNLDANQDDAVLRENLMLVKKHYTNWRDAVKKANPAAAATTGGSASTGASGIPQQFQKYTVD